MAKTKTNLKAQVLEVCKLYCSQVWVEALNQAGVEASSKLRRAESVYYPLAIQEPAPTSSKANTTPEVVGGDQVNDANDSTPTDKPAEGAEHFGALEKEKNEQLGNAPGCDEAFS